MKTLNEKELGRLVKRQGKGGSVRKLTAAAYGFTEVEEGLLEKAQPALKSLDLSNNNLASLTLALPSLLHLDVTNNELRSLGGLSGLTSLETIDCKANRRLPAHFKYGLAAVLPRLRSINGERVDVFRSRARLIATEVQSAVADKAELDAAACCHRVIDTVGKLSDVERAFLKSEINARFCDRTVKPQSKKKKATSRAPTPTQSKAASSKATTPNPTVGNRAEKRVASPRQVASHNLTSTDVDDTRGRRRSGRLSDTSSQDTPTEQSRRKGAATLNKQTASSAGKSTSKRKSGRAVDMQHSSNAPQPRSSSRRNNEHLSDTLPKPNTTRGSKSALSTLGTDKAARRKAVKSIPVTDPNGSECLESLESSPIRTKRAAPSETESGRTEKRKRHAAPLTGKFELKSLLRAHGRQDLRMADVQTEVWDCKFAPALGGEIAHNLAATCGGSVVCFIDVELGKVIKKYTHEGEEFCSLAWTVLPDSQSLVMAAAGKNGDIKVFDAKQEVCYAQLQGHNAYVTQILFNPEHPDQLASLDYAGCLLLWNVASLGAHENREVRKSGKKSQMTDESVHAIEGTDFTTFAFVNSSTIVAGSSDGQVEVWTFEVSKPPKRLGTPRGTIHQHYIDYIVAMGDGVFASRAEGEEGILMWRLDGYSSITKLCLLKAGKFKISFLRFSMIDFEEHDVRVVASGQFGEIFEFTVPNALIRSKNSAKGGVPRISPDHTYTSVKEQQQSPAATRAVAQSYDSRFLVATHGNNHVSVWRRTDA